MAASKYTLNDGQQQETLGECWKMSHRLLQTLPESWLGGLRLGRRHKHLRTFKKKL